MKTNSPFILSLFIFLWLSCEENSVTPEKPDPPQLDVAGEYIGAAKILCKEYRFLTSSQRTDTIIYLDEIIQDTFVVQDANPLDSLVSIHRVSFNRGINGISCRSSYDIGDPNGEYYLPSGKSWGYSYEYDKEWDSSIIFHDDNTLTGYMLERDIFSSTGFDSTGESYDYLRIFEFEIAATRQ